MTNKLTELKEAIQRAVPDTMELVEWCAWHDRATEKSCKDCLHMERPLELADVLRALQNNDKAPVGVDVNGYFLDCDDDMKEWWQLDLRWNLAETLDDQTPEVWDFLHGIIVK